MVKFFALLMLVFMTACLFGEFFIFLVSCAQTLVVCRHKCLHPIEVVIITTNKKKEEVHRYAVHQQNFGCPADVQAVRSSLNEFWRCRTKEN